MAKSDNLTDFLKGLADKLRSVLDTAEPISPQEFEDKIQGVYDKGFSQGGPTGITATAADVLSGKVFGSGGSAKATGTMPNRSDVSRPTKYQATDGAHLYSWIPYGFCANYDGNGHLIEQPFSSVASAIGLTAAKLMKGQTVLGITGTGETNPKGKYVLYACTGTYGGVYGSSNTWYASTNNPYVQKGGTGYDSNCKTGWNNVKVLKACTLKITYDVSGGHWADSTFAGLKKNGAAVSGHSSSGSPPRHAEGVYTASFAAGDTIGVETPPQTTKCNMFIELA